MHIVKVQMCDQQFCVALQSEVCVCVFKHFVNIESSEYSAEWLIQQHISKSLFLSLWSEAFC